MVQVSLPKLVRPALARLWVSVALAGLATVAAAENVTGAGASFPAPLYSKWADAYNKATGLPARWVIATRPPACRSITSRSDPAPG